MSRVPCPSSFLQDYDPPDVLGDNFDILSENFEALIGALPPAIVAEWKAFEDENGGGLEGFMEFCAERGTEFECQIVNFIELGLVDWDKAGMMGYGSDEGGDGGYNAGWEPDDDIDWGDDDIYGSGVPDPDPFEP